MKVSYADVHLSFRNVAPHVLYFVSGLMLRTGRPLYGRYLYYVSNAVGPVEKELSTTEGMLWIFAGIGDRDLVRSPKALNLSAIHCLGAGPALGLRSTIIGHLWGTVVGEEPPFTSEWFTLVKPRSLATCRRNGAQSIDTGRLPAMQPIGMSRNPRAGRELTFGPTREGPCG